MDTKKNRVMAGGIAAGRERRRSRVKLSGNVGTGNDARNRCSYSICVNIQTIRENACLRLRLKRNGASWLLFPLPMRVNALRIGDVVTSENLVNASPLSVSIIDYVQN